MSPAREEPTAPRDASPDRREPGRRAEPEGPLQPAYNRDDEMKPGRPPRTAYEPKGSEGSSRTPKTATDPASGEWRGDPPAPSDADETAPSEDR
jgi:hypothetical protein